MQEKEKRNKEFYEHLNMQVEKILWSFKTVAFLSLSWSFSPGSKYVLLRLIIMSLIVAQIERENERDLLKNYCKTFKYILYVNYKTNSTRDLKHVFPQICGFLSDSIRYSNGQTNGPTNFLLTKYDFIRSL